LIKKEKKQLTTITKHHIIIVVYGKTRRHGVVDVKILNGAAMVTSRNAHHSIIHRHRRGYRRGLLRVFNIIIIIIIVVVVRRVNNDDALISVCRARYDLVVL